MRRRRDKKIWLVIAGVFVIVFGITLSSHKINNNDADAANLAGFDAGYIISDFQMSNYTSMNEGQIQNFLKSMNSCDDYNTSKTGNNIGHLSESTPYSWHVKDGHYVCMADENFNGESAAHIIWRAAQDYQINPQVLIVLLQKEQGLVTDTFPNSVQYRSATGYGCPDTAACSSTYYGFKNQVRNAAAMFRSVLNGGWTNYPLGNNYVKYNPNAACGGSVVNIRNLATSALYRDTPYQPNAVTLAGGSDACSAYGNKNFYVYFEDWFGGIKKTGEARSKGRTIEDGTYQFVSKATGQVIGVKDGFSDTKGDLQMNTKSLVNTDYQVFEVKYGEDGYYNITNAKTGLSFDVKGAKTANSTHVGVFQPHSNCNQDWVLEKDSSGYYTVTSRCSSRVLDATSLNNVVIFDNHNGDNQKWELVKLEDVDKNHTISDGTYQFVSKATDQVISVKDGALAYTGDLKMEMKMRAGVSSQLFSVKYEDDGYYSITNPRTGLAFDVKGAKTANSTHVGIYQPHTNCNQDWMFKEGSDGYYVIVSRCSNRALDATTLNNVVIFDQHNGDNQKWELVKAEELGDGRTIEDGTYQFVSKATGQVIGVKDGFSDTKGDLQMNTKSLVNTDYQVFEVKYGEDGYYNITNAKTGLSFDVKGAKTANSTHVGVFQPHSNCNQDWVLEKDSSGYYTVTSRCSSRVLDATSLNNVVIFDNHNGDNQKWELVKQ